MKLTSELFAISDVVWDTAMPCSRATGSMASLRSPMSFSTDYGGGANTGGGANKVFSDLSRDRAGPIAERRP